MSVSGASARETRVDHRIKHDTGITVARILLGVVLLVGQLAFVSGAAWDIQWHLVIGRDRPFIPPHLLLLFGIALTGVAALIGVLGFSIASRLGRATSKDTVALLGVFRAPLGVYVAGIGALFSAIAFPLDDYWHRLYGLDVTLWAPFHVMIISGMALAGLGTAYVFAVPPTEAGAAFAQPARQPFAKTATHIGVAISLAMTMAIVLLLLGQAMDREGIIAVRPRPLVAFPPLLVGMTVPWLVAATVAVTFPGGATVAALVLTALRFALFAFVPWAVQWAAAIEGQVIRPSAPPFVATPLSLPAWILVAAIIVDATWWLARTRRLGSGRLLPIALLVASGVGASLLLAVLDRPWLRTLPLVRGGATLDLQAALVNSLPYVAAVGAVGVLLGSLVGMGLRRAVQPAIRPVIRRPIAPSLFLSLGLFGALLLVPVMAFARTPGPASIPLWLGWLMGLVPVWSLSGFVLAQAARAWRSSVR